jgi:hypothetical protein
MSHWTHRTVIVPDAYVALARSLAAAATVDEGHSGAGMFTTPLSATGTGEPTHWISAGLMWPEFADMLSDPQAIFEASGGQVPLSTIQAMLSASVIRQDANPHAVLQERGLKIVQESE